eukprot:gene13577-14985_t
MKIVREKHLPADAIFKMDRDMEAMQSLLALHQTNSQERPSMSDTKGIVGKLIQRPGEVDAIMSSCQPWNIGREV